MVIQLLDSCESDSYDQAKHGMAHSALNYYGSKFSLIPDVIPGLGYLDDFLILVTTMWVCGERELPEPSPHEDGKNSISIPSVKSDSTKFGFE